MTAGYSGTPLPKKLGLKEDGTLIAINAPPHFDKTLGPLPRGAALSNRLQDDYSLAILFCKNAAELTKNLPRMIARLHIDGILWVAWPKKKSKRFVDLTEDGIRKAALPTGLVDVKVCAVDDDWSGLKLMVRRTLRDKWKDNLASLASG
jgi:hypothetical protein